MFEMCGGSQTSADRRASGADGARVMGTPAPYRSTPIFDEITLPAGLRREHRTKVGVWGVIRVLEGRLRYRVLDPVSEIILDAEHPGIVIPDQPHLVEPIGPVRLCVDFYDQEPQLEKSGAHALHPGFRNE